MGQEQAQQDGCMEELCHSPSLLAAAGLDAAGLQDILQQPFCPAPILSADPCWQLPRVCSVLALHIALKIIPCGIILALQKLQGWAD